MASSTMAGLNLSTPKLLPCSSDSQTIQTIKFPWLNRPWKRPAQFGSGRMMVRPIMASPSDLSDKVAESITEAKEACAEDPASGECKAAWDEVEELSAAVSHEKVKKKSSDPLEEFCKDNMETDECRTYED